MFGLDQFPDCLHKVNANLTADQIAGTDKERLCVSKIPMEAGATQYIVNIHVLSGIFEMPGEFDSIVYTYLNRITVNYYAH